MHGAHTAEQGSVAWTRHAQSALKAAGYRSSGPRSAVVDVLGREPCVMAAKDIVDELRAGGREIGIATVYRALEVLSELGLVQRLDVGEGSARFERAEPSGEHHHHLLCERCGRVAAFEDAGLEQAIALIARRLDYRVGGHEVTLRGACPGCSATAT